MESEDQAGKLISDSEAISKLGIESVYEPTSIPEEELNKETTIKSRRKSTRGQNKSKEVADVPKRQYIRKKIPKLSEEEKNRRDELDFEDYYNLNKDLWKADHPDVSNEEVRKLLRDIWDEMDAEEKSNNLNRNFDDYRYNSTADQLEVNRVKTNLQENYIKNTENPQLGIESSSKINDKSDNKINPENEKEIEISKTNGTPQKEKVNEVFNVSGSPKKEKSKFSEITGDSQNERIEEISKPEIDSQNGKDEDCEIKSSQMDLKNENLKQNFLKKSDKEKVCESCLKKEDFGLRTSINETETKVKITEKGEENDKKIEGNFPL